MVMCGSEYDQVCDEWECTKRIFKAILRLHNNIAVKLKNADILYCRLNVVVL